MLTVIGGIIDTRQSNSVLISAVYSILLVTAPRVLNVVTLPVTRRELAKKAAPPAKRLGGTLH
jgi:hypothetical protein